MRNSFTQFLVFVSSMLALSLGITTKVLYGKVSGGKVSVQCAVEAIQESYVGVKIQDETDQCEALPSSWSGSLTPGYTYLERKGTVNVYKHGWKKYVTTDQVRSYVHFWTLPGKVGVGTRVEVHFQIPTDSTWEVIEYSTEDSRTKMRHALIVINAQNGFTARRYIDDGKLDTQDTNYRMHFMKNVNYVVSIVALGNQFKMINASMNREAIVHWF
ncbi:hypothetical protein ACF0H5_004435 [Mactra antiquata]